MKDELTDAGIKFGFNRTNTSDNKQIDNVTSPVEGDALNNVNIITENKVKEDEDLNAEYTDEKSVTISLIKDYSLYRKSNDKVLLNRKDYIGSSINSSRILSSNKEEIDTYFPNIIGLSPSDPNFVNRVKQYLNNIRIGVDELGKKFNISFRYRHKKDYLIIKKLETDIEMVYEKVNRQNLEDVKTALKKKIIDLNILESSKCKLGYPVNVEEYLMYRHCLLYNDVAKDIIFANSDKSVRFYFKDDNKEAEKLRNYRVQVNKAKSNYVTCLSDNELFDSVYIQYCSISGLSVIASLAESRMDKEIKLDKFSMEEPIKFNDIFNNKDIKLISIIEILIARGELIRSQYNQNITTTEGDFIGANIKEAVVWFKSPQNSSIVNAYYNRLKNI